MYNFKGINPEIIELLAINRFNDSKPFYEENKEVLKQGATIPMRQIVLDMSETICDIDPLADMNPTYIVSRIRRDTRRSKDKLMYRDNLWLMMRRNKVQFPCAPYFWFEFSPDFYMYGIGMHACKPAQMDCLRKIILENPDEWLKAVELAQKANLKFTVNDFYKKDRIENAPENLKLYLNAKKITFSFMSNDLTVINSTKIIDDLKNMVLLTEPMYKILIKAYDMAVSEGIINADNYKR